jgi:cytochrome c oxidase subunit 2
MLLNLINNHASNYQFGFQIPASPVMEGIINFHHDLFFFLTAILFFVFYLFIRCLILFNKNANTKPIVVTHAPLLEII